MSNQIYLQIPQIYYQILKLLLEEIQFYETLKTYLKKKQAPNGVFRTEAMLCIKNKIITKIGKQLVSDFLFYPNYFFWLHLLLEHKNKKVQG